MKEGSEVVKRTEKSFVYTFLLQKAWFPFSTTRWNESFEKRGGKRQRRVFYYSICILIICPWVSWNPKKRSFRYLGVFGWGVQVGFRVLFQVSIFVERVEG